MAARHSASSASSSRLANDSVFKERENYLGTLRKTAQIDEKL